MKKAYDNFTSVLYVQVSAGPECEVKTEFHDTF